MSIQNRYDFLLLFDVKDGNPNGDPDAGNLPRLDVETGCGLVTDVCLKRKIRNYVGLLKKEQPPYEIFIKEKSVLNYQIERAYEESDAVKSALATWHAWKKDKKNKPRPEKHYEDVAKEWMCNNFYDIRTFGAVMSTGDKQDEDNGQSKIKKVAGQVRGPVQITFSRSIDPIVFSEHTITRMAVTNEKDLEKERTMGRKFTVPYGLYVAHGFVSASLAEQTGFSDEDMNLLLEALTNMFEQDRSAARGEMITRGLYVFKHESKLGNAQAHALFDRVKISRQTDGPARNFTDYKVEIDASNLPQGVILERIVG